QPDELVVQDMAVGNASCFGFCDGEATATVVGGTLPYTYTWSDGTAVENVTSGLCVGGYDLTVEDANGCIAINVFNVTQPPMLQITSMSSTDVLCNGDCNGSIMISATAATEFSVDNGVTFQAAN